MLISKIGKHSIATIRQYWCKKIESHRVPYDVVHLYNGTFKSFIKMKIHFIIIIITVNAISIMVIECKACCHSHSFTIRSHSIPIPFWNPQSAAHNLFLSIYLSRHRIAISTISHAIECAIFKWNAIHSTAHFVCKWTASKYRWVLVWQNDKILTTMCRNVWLWQNMKYQQIKMVW